MVIGVRTDKRFTDGYKYVNRYWINVTDLNEAGDFIGIIAENEAIIHCQYAVIYNVHTWVPNATPNDKKNYPLSVIGEFGASGMLRPQITARAFFTTPSSSNPMYKDYRVRVASGELANGTWGSAFLTSFAAYASAMNGASIPFCTRSGDLLGDIFPSNQYEFRQLSKQWYNRAETP
jgi:hypothetical protein